MSDTKVPAKGRRGHNLKGRLPGVKNKSTILKEVLRNGFEKQIQKDFKAVVGAVIDKAKDGDMTAAKLILDRVVPVSKAVDLEDVKKGGLQININVGSLEEDLKVVNEPEDEFVVEPK